MPTLQIDENFIGFTNEQRTAIYLAAKHFSQAKFKGKKRKPVCIIGDEKFEITQVRSDGPSHQVRRTDGKWITLNGSAVVCWQEKGPPPTVPLDPETLKPAAPPSPEKAAQQIHTALTRIETCHALLEQTAKDLWGIGSLFDERERVVRIAHMLRSLRGELQAAARTASPQPATENEKAGH